MNRRSRSPTRPCCLGGLGWPSGSKRTDDGSPSFSTSGHSPDVGRRNTPRRRAVPGRSAGSGTRSDRRGRRPGHHRHRARVRRRQSTSARHADLAEAQRTARRLRRRLTIAVVAVALVAALGAGVVAFVQTDEAENARADASIAAGMAREQRDAGAAAADSAEAAARDAQSRRWWVRPIVPQHPARHRCPARRRIVPARRHSREHARRCSPRSPTTSGSSMRITSAVSAVATES